MIAMVTAIQNTAAELTVEAGICRPALLCTPMTHAAASHVFRLMPYSTHPVFSLRAGLNRFQHCGLITCLSSATVPEFPQAQDESYNRRSLEPTESCPPRRSRTVLVLASGIRTRRGTCLRCYRKTCKSRAGNPAV